MAGDATVLVTGAGGYIGRHVVTALLDRGARVVAVDRAARVPGGSRVDPRATVLGVDIFDADEASYEALHSPDVVVHLAWEAGFHHGSPAHMSRLSDHYRFLTRLVAEGASHLTVAGTMHEIGYHEGEIDADTPTHPQTLYGIAKNALREALEVELRGGPVTFQWLRCFYIYGDDEANSSIFAKIAQAAERGDTTFPFTTGANKFDFIEVDELAAQIAAVAMQTEETGIINCCSGTPESLAHRAESFIAERGYDIRLEYGAFPDRPFESPATWGNADVIRRIMASAG